MTNYERIKQMSVEEMATFLQEVEYRRAFDGSGAKWKSKGTVINWLESEAEDNALQFYFCGNCLCFSANRFICAVLSDVGKRL